MAASTIELRKKVDRLLIEHQAARLRHKQEKQALCAATAHLVATKAATMVAQAVAKAVQEQAHAQVADIVSRSLKAVFGPDAYRFKIIFEKKRGRTEATLVFDREGMVVDPMTASGGGVIDVAGFALRVSCLLLSRPPLRRLLVLDEPLRFLSEQYQPRARELIESLAKELGVQFLIVTHNKQLTCGKVVEL
jgi:ABC-type dipeptide/oligopeptide/nickel transport system ATPase subunit